MVRYDQPMYTLYFEADYASGDSDPTTRSPLTQFRFAEDSNVGLLMFKHILAYQSGRAAASGVQLLRDLRAPSYPTDAIASARLVHERLRDLSAGRRPASEEPAASAEEFSWPGRQPGWSIPSSRSSEKTVFESKTIS